MNDSEHFSPYKPDFIILHTTNLLNRVLPYQLLPIYGVKHYPIPIKWTDTFYGGDLDQSPPDFCTIRYNAITDQAYEGNITDIDVIDVAFWAYFLF